MIATWRSTASGSYCGCFRISTSRAPRVNCCCVDILKQPQYEPLAVERQVAIIYAAINGYMDEVALGDVRAFETELYRALESRHPEILTGIRDKKQLDDQLKGGLDSAVKAFSTDFLARKSAAA